MNGKCFFVLYYGHVTLNEWEMLLCALLWHVILNEWEMLLCALLWACNTEWMGNAFLFFIMGM